MTTAPTPELHPELSRRIRLVRRDLGDLLFHFTRGDEPVVKKVGNVRLNTATTAANRLTSILRQGALRGSSHWTYGLNTICFTEAPIQEFNAIFELASIASERKLRPRYEPYGVAVSKSWLYARGGRPVIYEAPSQLENFSTVAPLSLLPIRSAKEYRLLTINIAQPRPWRRAVFIGESPATPRPSAPG